MQAIMHQKTRTKLILIACLAAALCVMPCGMADSHHASAANPSVLCSIADLPQVFQLAIVTDMLLFAFASLLIIPQAPVFSLLKPPRFRFALA
ncbi:MAG: hypothetical protein C3F08_06805 [Candidatus Methylomirabilota bacterium]|nr:MAG: hypothetical protein C3F08_06805 [candidate division NC10 bacterium]